MKFARSTAMISLIALVVVACNPIKQLGEPEDLGLVGKFPSKDLKVSIDPRGLDDQHLKEERNDILSEWVMNSDYNCAQYQFRLSRTIRDARLGTDVVATVLSGLAAIFTQANTVRPLAGSAAIALGIGSDIQSDLFLQQASDIVANAIQTVRNAARTDLQKNWTASYSEYTLAEGLLDVERYDRETCTINTALSNIRTALGISAPSVLALNNPIVGVQSATSSTTGPQTTTTVVTPPHTMTSQGTTVVVPGQVQISTTPAQPAPVRQPPQVPRAEGTHRGVALRHRTSTTTVCNPQGATLTAKEGMITTVQKFGDAPNADAGKLAGVAEKLDNLPSVKKGAISKNSNPVPKANAIVVFIRNNVCTPGDLSKILPVVNALAPPLKTP